MRIPKAYWINGILLILAIGGWAALLRDLSPARKKAEAEAFAASFLLQQLPQGFSNLQLLLEAPSGG